jgi:hypothetical protein
MTCDGSCALPEKFYKKECQAKNLPSRPDVRSFFVSAFSPTV